ncbi:WD repeat domain 90 [Perkinsus olseni]|uniref:WD repeat domain 90 n=1 Tax=Perkinsus olseni TaxID=32597 RepID=A0A7J6QTQ7_PEROL|nr:WD repeat domain 90 [Perkinsus olseni]
MPTAPTASLASSAGRGEKFWQNPFVNIQKVFGGQAQLKGEVSEELDRELSKRVKRIYGSISANNFIRYPGGKSTVKALDLTGNYAYIMMRTIADRCFVIHIDVDASDGNNLRISLSNMFKTTKVQAPRTIQCPVHPPVDRWCIVCVYISGVIALYSPTSGGRGKVSGPKHLLPDVHFVKSIQVGASLLLRGIFTSDNHYLMEDLPREMQLTHKQGTEAAWIEVPITKATKHDTKQGSDTTDSILTRLEPTSPLPSTTETFILSPQEEGKADENKANPNLPALPILSERPQLTVQPLELKKVLCARPQLSSKATSNPRRTTAGQRRFAVWVRDQASGLRPSVCSSSAGHLSLSSLGSQSPTELSLITGCGLVSCLAGADAGNTILTAESGDPPVVRLWRPSVSEAPVCVISCPMLAGIDDICSDPDSRRICILGKDAQRKQQQLCVWNIPPPPVTRGKLAACKSKAELIAKHVCGAWPIQALRFSPFRPSAHTNIVSCGFENIRFWRVKDQHLAGVSVQLNQLARETVFTDLDFEASKSLRPAGAVPQDTDGKEEEAAILHYRVFVATACGRVIQLHYNTRQVENVNPRRRYVIHFRRTSHGGLSFVGLAMGASESSMPLAIALVDSVREKVVTPTTTMPWVGPRVLWLSGQRLSRAAVVVAMRPMRPANQRPEAGLSSNRLQKVAAWGSLSLFADMLDPSPMDHRHYCGNKLIGEAPEANEAQGVLSGKVLAAISQILESNRLTQSPGVPPFKYRLYDDGCPIWAITVTEGFVCTAGDDGYVRVWPLDFTNYYMQAKLPGPVYGLDLTPDDLQLVCSVGDGSVGVLDLEACKYTVVSRSHKSKIRCAAVSFCGTKLCTAAADGCMRVWEIANGTARTLLEFKAEPDLPTSLAFQRSIAVEDDEAPLLAAGFESGAVMIFEISAVGDHTKTSSPMFELKHHAHPVTSLSFASVSSSSLLLSGDTTGRVVVHDEARKFEATRCPDSVVSKPILPVVPSTKEDVQIQPPTFALRPASHRHTMLALYSHERAIALAQLPDLETSRVLKVNHLQKATAAITTYTFSADGVLLLVGLSDSWVRVYDPDSGLLEHSINCVMAGMVTALYMSAALKGTDGRKIITAGHLDHQLRVSDYYRDGRSDDPLHRPGEQTYHAHHFPPREIFAVGELLLTASSTEVCLWSFPYLFESVDPTERLVVTEKKSVESIAEVSGVERVTVEGRGLFQSFDEDEDDRHVAPVMVMEDVAKTSERSEENKEIIQYDTEETEERPVEIPVAENVEKVERSEAVGRITYHRFCGGGSVVLWLSELGHLATGCHRWVHLASLVEDRDTYLIIPDSVIGPRRITSLDLSPLTMRTLLASADDGRWMVVWDLVEAGIALAAEDGEEEERKMSKFVQPLSVTHLPEGSKSCKLLADSLALSCSRGTSGDDQSVGNLVVWGLPRTETCKEAKVLATASLQLPARTAGDLDVEIVVNPLSAMEFVTMTSESVIMWQLATSEEGSEEDRVRGWGLAFNEVVIPDQFTGSLCSVAMSSPHLFVGTTTGFVMVVDTDVCELVAAVGVFSTEKPLPLSRLSPLPIASKEAVFGLLAATDDDCVHGVSLSKDLLGVWESKLEPEPMRFTEGIASIQFFGSANDGVVITQVSAATVWFVDWDKRIRARLRSMVPRSPVGMDCRAGLLAVASSRDVVLYRPGEHGRLEGLTRYHEAAPETVSVKCVTIISSDGLDSIVVGLSDGRARVYNLNQEKAKVDYIQLEVFREEAITAVAAFKGRRVLVGSASGVLAWTTIPIHTSQPARLARLASVPARAEAFCAGLSGGQLWAGYIRKQPAVRCVMQSTWMVKGLTSATCLSRGRVVAAGENTVFLFKMGTPAPVLTHEMGFPPLRVGRVGPDLIGVVGDGAKLRTLSVEESTVKVQENM